jgi:hypothetical protein
VYGFQWTLSFLLESDYRLIGKYPGEASHNVKLLLDTLVPVGCRIILELNKSTSHSFSRDQRLNLFLSPSNISALYYFDFHSSACFFSNTDGVRKFKIAVYLVQLQSRFQFPSSKAFRESLLPTKRTPCRPLLATPDDDFLCLGKQVCLGHQLVY